MGRQSEKQVARERRHSRVRRKVTGTETRPRVCICRSNKNLYAQFIDDVNGRTLLTVSTLSKELRDGVVNRCNKKYAERLGELSGNKAREMGLKEVVFDRGGCQYHGCIQALAEAMRKAGLTF